MIHFYYPLHAPGDDLPPPQVDEYGIPENPFAPPPETQLPAVRRRRAARSEGERPAEPAPGQPPVHQAAQAQPVTQAQPVPGPQFQPPVSPEIPDWLRTAQQNNLPLNNRPQGPRVQAAPRPSQPQGMRPAQGIAPYRPTVQGYPQQSYQPEVQEAPIQRRRPPQQAYAPQQSDQPWAQEAPIQRRRPPQQAYAPQRSDQPGAQEAPIQRRRPQPDAAAHQPEHRRSAMTPEAYQHLHSELQQEGWYVSTDEEELPRETPYWIKRIPWLGIAAFLAVGAAVFLWILGLNYQNQLTDVLDARAAQEARLAENHPLKYEQLIQEMADKYNLSPAYVAAIMLNESSFRPQATAESTGARGLMQLVSPTAEWIHTKLYPDAPFSFDAMYTAEINAEYGCWYLNYLSELFAGDPVLVTAAYHAGQTEVRNWLDTDAYSPDGKTIAIDKIPITATRRYVARVLNAYAAYLRIHFGG